MPLSLREPVALYPPTGRARTATGSVGPQQYGSPIKRTAFYREEVGRPTEEASTYLFDTVIRYYLPIDAGLSRRIIDNTWQFEARGRTDWEILSARRTEFAEFAMGMMLEIRVQLERVAEPV